MSTAPLRLMLFDPTCPGPLPLTGLSDSWRWGGRLYGLLGRLDGWHAAASWAEGLQWLATHQPSRRIGEIQYWGHGRPGQLFHGRAALDRAALQDGHALRPALEAIRGRLAGPEALWWFRTCLTFAGAEGHAFAQAWTGFFGARAAGHTHVIGPLQPGLHSLRPGAAPHWPVTEGADQLDKPSDTGWLVKAPNTITCLTGRIPDGF
jgi:hypothetical protein